MLAKKIAFNTVISVAARVLSTAIALVSIGLLTRYLSRDAWGEYSIVITFGGVFAVLAEWGLYQLAIREISKEGADQKKIVGNLFTMRLIISLFVFSAAPIIALSFPYSGRAQLGILVGMAGFWLLSGAQVLMGVFQKYLRMDKASLADVIGRLVQLGLVILFIRLQFGFLWLVAAMSVSALINFLLVFWFARQYVHFSLSFDLSFWRRSFWQSFPLAVANILVMIYFSTDSLFLSVFKPASDVGIYRLPYKMLESLIFFPAMFVGLVMPLLSGEAGRDRTRFKNIFQRSFDVLSVFALPLVAGTIVLSPAIINLLGGGRYGESVAVLNILIVAVGVIFFSTLFSFSLIAMEKQKSLLWISGAGALFNIALNLIFIPRFSYYAAAVTTVLTEALVAVLMLAVIWRFLNFLPSFSRSTKNFLAALVMAAVLWRLQFLNLFLLLALGAIIYFGFLYLIKGISRQEIALLVKRDGSL